MTDLSDLIVYSEQHVPPRSETDRFIVIVREESGLREWRVVDRVGKPVDYENGKGTIFQEDSWLSNVDTDMQHWSPLSDDVWLLDGDSEPGFCVMMQAERYGEDASAAIEHCRLLRKHANLIPSLLDYEWDDACGWSHV